MCAARTTVADALRDADIDALDARVLLCHALDWPRSALITRADWCLDDTAPDALARYLALAARRRAGEPVAQLTGMREFYGRPFRVTADVLIPRPDTELLVELALNSIDRLSAGRAGTPLAARPLRVLDLGTGSGAIGVTLAAERPAIEVTATDRSAAALEIARQNADALLGPRAARAIRFAQGDWFDALSTGTGEQKYAHGYFDLIVSNPPYISRDDVHLTQGDLRFEPRGALTDEADGLGPLRTIAAQAARWLAPRGAAVPESESVATVPSSPMTLPAAGRESVPALLIEHGYDQGLAARDIFLAAGWQDVSTARDLGSQERVTLGSPDTARQQCQNPLSFAQ